MIAAARESLDHQWCQRVGFHFLTVVIVFFLTQRRVLTRPTLRRLTFRPCYVAHTCWIHYILLANKWSYHAQIVLLARRK